MAFLTWYRHSLFRKWLSKYPLSHARIDVIKFNDIMLFWVRLYLYYDVCFLLPNLYFLLSEFWTLSSFRGFFVFLLWSYHFFFHWFVLNVPLFLQHSVLINCTCLMLQIKEMWLVGNEQILPICHPFLNREDGGTKGTDYEINKQKLKDDNFYDTLHIIVQHEPSKTRRVNSDARHGT